MKPVFIVLALVGAIFFVLLFVSSPSDEQPDPAHPPSLVSIAGSALERFGPRVTFAQTAYSVTGEPVVVPVPASEDQDDRTPRVAKVRVAPPNCETVRITYQPAAGETSDMKLDQPQTWNGSEADRCAGSLLVGPKGGTLTIVCAPQQACSVDLGS